MRKLKHLIAQELRAIYAEFHAKAIVLRTQGKKYMEVCDELHCLGYRPRTG